jgi:acyl carrier protein
MDDLRARLIVCFTAVFPGLTPDEAPNASTDTLPAWDSSNHFLLMQTIEETFGIQIPEELLGEIDSFAGFERYLAQKSDGS